jgi:hypothetical protein
MINNQNKNAKIRKPTILNITLAAISPPVNGFDLVAIAKVCSVLFADVGDVVIVGLTVGDVVGAFVGAVVGIKVGAVVVGVKVGITVCRDGSEEMGCFDGCIVG